tara:strand:+ start:1805 stop:2134 length:330 start_codon:yes stop_codon:yes gene_type:complete
MTLNKTLEKLLASKNELLESVEVCCKSIEFWEERANEVFSRMDKFEEESFLSSEEQNQKQYACLIKESNKIMSRVNFENNQLDILEAKILDLEETIIKALSKYAKKQKK